MKPQEEQRQVVTGGAVAGAQFGISQKNIAHILGILREGIYSDKVLAVIREYASNAWDAHRVIGKADIPIEVHLPEEDDPFFRVRDHGPGLSRQDVLNVYTQYGESTKRADDNAVGMLGIGSKSFFAYTDSFTITSWFGGQKSIYTAALDETDCGVLSLMHEEACDPTETGIEVSGLVKEDDFSTFHNRAVKLFTHFEPRPTINCVLPDPPEDRAKLPSGSIDYVGHDGDYEAGKWIAVMGCVPYRLRLDDVPLTSDQQCLKRLSGVVRFNIGEVQVAASREDLKYTERTKKALVEKLTALVDEYVAHAIDKLNAVGAGTFQARLQALTLQQLQLPLPEFVQDLAKTWVKVFDETADVYFVRNGSTTNQVTIDSSLELYIDDTGNKLEGYHSLGQYDYVVRARKGGAIPEGDAASQADAIEASLQTYIDAAGLTGVPVKRLSALYWTKPYEKPKKVKNVKHKARMFRLIRDSQIAKPYSEAWEVVDRVPEETDVYIVLRNFEPYASSISYGDIRSDRALADEFESDYPEVYAYKDTEKKPLDASKVVGKPYSVWRETWTKSLWTPERAEMANAVFATRILPCKTQKQQDSLAREFGTDHPIVGLLREHDVAMELVKAMTVRESQLIKLAERNSLSQSQCPAKTALDAVLSKYPLMQIERGHSPLDCLWKSSYYDQQNESRKKKAWRDYVKMIDRLETLDATQNHPQDDVTQPQDLAEAAA